MFWKIWINCLFVSNLSVAKNKPEGHFTRKFLISCFFIACGEVIVIGLSVFCLPLQVWLEEEEQEKCEDRELKGPVMFCIQAEHAGTRTYYFSTDSHEEQKEWIRAMSDASKVNVHATERCCLHTCTEPYWT